MNPMMGQMGMNPMMGQMGMNPMMGQMGMNTMVGQMGMNPMMGQMGMNPMMGQIRMNTMMNSMNQMMNMMQQMNMNQTTSPHINQNSEFEQMKKELEELKKRNTILENNQKKYEEQFKKQYQKEENEKLKERTERIIKDEEKIKAQEKNLNYKFNEYGQLLNNETLQKIEKVSQKEYDKIAKYLRIYIRYLLLKKYDMFIQYVPTDKNEINFYKRIKEIPQSYILCTDDLETNPTCLVIICGSGQVVSGLFAQSACINENLDQGSIIPYINRARKNNYSVIVFNPNQNYDLDDEKKEVKFEKDHWNYVYSNIIKKIKIIKNIIFMAHSAGASKVIKIIENNSEDIKSNKIKCIVFTDCFSNYDSLPDDVKNKALKITRNYVSSKKSLGTFIEKRNDISCYSAGDDRHEYTSYSAVEEIFMFIKQMI
jgi:predicted alpha/beta hydrolase family esterase